MYAVPILVYLYDIVTCHFNSRINQMSQNAPLRFLRVPSFIGHYWKNGWPVHAINSIESLFPLCYLYIHILR